MDRSGEPVGARAGAVFISYRRDDAAGHAGRVFDTLVRDMGAERVFMDVDGIAPGADFVARIEEAVEQGDALIALIGRRWLDASSTSGKRRLEDPSDVVRLEIASALEGGLRVIPVLVDGASMPRAQDLPEDLAPLALRNAVELTETRWAYDTSRLVDAIRDHGADPDEHLLLPALRQPLVGRDHDLQAIQRMIHDDPGAVITITGPGGIGKTTLAIEAARRLTTGNAEPLFCDLTEVQSADEVVPSVARAAGRDPPSDDEELAALGKDLTEARALLVLDNFEHVLDAASDLQRLLDRAPKLSCLITSRAPLRISGEHEYPLAPLALPPDRQDLDAGALEGIAAVEVFVRSARRASPDFELTDANAGATAEVCRRLDGLPLALELAAARTTLLTPQDMLEHLDQSLRLLTRGGRDHPERHQTVRATVEWSHRLLGESEREVFARLAVFATGPTLSAIEAVCEAADPIALVDDLQSLVENNLVKAGEGADGERRFRMLEVIREFAREQLAALEAAERVTEAHARFYAERAETIAPKLEGADSLDSFTWFDTEYPNLEAATLWAQDLDEPETSVRLLTALCYYVLSRSRFEAQAWYLHASRRPNLSPAQAAPVLLGLAMMRLSSGDDVDTVPKLVDDCIAACEAAGDTRVLVLAYVALQGFHADGGDAEKAAAAGDRALELALEAENFWLAANQMSNNANDALIGGDFRRATALCAEAIEFSEAHGFEDSAAGAHSNFAVAALMENDNVVAAAHAARAIELGVKFGELALLMHFIAITATVLSRTGRHQEAGLLFGVVAAAETSTGDRLQRIEATLRDEALEVTAEALGSEVMRERLAAGASLNLDEGIKRAVDALEEVLAGTA